MSSPQIKPTEKPIDPPAESAIKLYAQNLASLLLLHAKIIAAQANREKVSILDIEEAIKIINRNRTTSWRKELLIVLGGALFGAFIQGFITEVWNKNPILIIIYVVVGFIGITMVFIGLIR
jgi:hypothetical protein